jgi:hypothetical protein
VFPPAAEASAKALHLSAPAPRGADHTAATKPHLPLCTARGRPSRLLGVLHLRGAAPGHRHLLGPVHARGAAPVEASGVHALRRCGTTRSRRRRRRGRGRCGGPAERWPELVTVTVPMLPWSVPLWMDDSTPSRQRGTGGAHPWWRWTCRQAWLPRAPSDLAGGAICFWLLPLETRFVAAAFAPWQTGAAARRRRWRLRRGRGAGTQRRPTSRWLPPSGVTRWCGAAAADIR